MEACTSSPRPKRSLVMIDSISINIYAAEQSQSDKCDHFTIRGFVSDTRAKNGPHCWPLSIDCNDPSSKDSNSRPHIDVPKFRRWQCQSCLSEIDTEGALEDAVNTTINCSRRLKTKSYCFHRSLENVVAHLSKKSEQHQELACKGTETAPAFRQKRLADSGIGENELHGAASDFISKQHVRKKSKHQLSTATYVDEHHEKWPISAPDSYTKVDISDGAKHSRRHAAGTKLVQNCQNLDDSGVAGRRKTKKVRLLDDLFSKDTNGDQPAVTRGFDASKAAKVSNSALGQKRNKKCHEQDSRHSQMHNADGSDGKGLMGKAQDIKSTFADAEMHMASKNESSDAIIKQTQKMLLGSNQGADVQKNNYNRGQKRNMDLCGKQVSLSTCLSLLGRAMDPQQNSIITSLQFKGKSNNTSDKVHQDVNVLTPAESSKEICGTSVSKNPPMEKVQIGHQTQSVQDDHSSTSHYNLSDGCLDTSKCARHAPHTENGSLPNEFTIQYMGESRSVCGSLIDKNLWQRTNSSLCPKRPNQGPCIGNKKRKYSARTEGLTVVHQTELLFGTSNEGVVGSQESPEHRENMMQEVGNSDDIPMEIVELMAKNLHERRLHEVGDSYYMPQLGSNLKRDLVGSTTVLSGVVAATAQNPNTNLPSSLPNARVTSVKGSGVSIKRPNGNMTQRPTGSYCPVLSSQGDLSIGFQSPSLGSCKPDLLRNSKFDMNNFPPQHRVSPKSRALYEEWQPPRQSEKTAYAYGWPMIPPNNPVHMLRACQASSLHPFDVGKVPTGSSYIVEGRGLSNLSLAGFGNSSSSVGPECFNASRPSRVNSRSQITISQDTFSNETLTAMHLLSLMDGGMQSSSLTNTEANANRKTFDRSFSNDHLAKELSMNSIGVSKSNHKFKQPSPYGYQSNAGHSDASFKCSPPFPRFGSVGMSLPGDVGNKKGTLSHQQERSYLNRTAADLSFADEKNGYKSQSSLLACNFGITGQEYIPAHELSKHISGPMWSGSSSSTHAYMNGKTSGHCNTMPRGSHHTSKGRAEPGACYVNRNPMDFTTPGPGNEYMIGTEELNFRNRIHNPYITGLIATNTPKQNMFTSYTTSSNRL